MNFKKLAVFLTLILGSLSLFAHEGHDSSLAKSQYGGIVKKTKNTFVEVVKDEAIELYIMDHDYKSLAAPGLKVNVVAETKTKKIPVQVQQKDKKYLLLTDLSKERHFKLNVKVTMNGKEESAVFPLEN